MKDLQALMSHISRVWVCDKNRYLELNDMTSSQRKNFLIKHSLLHISKTSGRIATVCEKFDHAGEIDGEDNENLRVATLKMFVNALKLAEEVGLTADDLLNESDVFIR